MESSGGQPLVQQTVAPEGTVHTEVHQGVTKDDLASLEKLFDTKLGSLRWQGVAALLGGQSMAAVVASWIAAPKQTEQVISFIVSALPFL